MNRVQMKLTVFFDGTIWIGLFERVSDGSLEVAKVRFGAEPKEIELYQWILSQYASLSFSSSILLTSKAPCSCNPKRRKRLVTRQLSQSIGTKAQKALQLQREQTKQLQKEKQKKKREVQMKQKFEQRQEKKYKRHRGH